MPARGRARRRRGRGPASRRSLASTPDACGALKSRARPRSSTPGTPRRQAPARGRPCRRQDRRLRLDLDALRQRDEDVEWRRPRRRAARPPVRPRRPAAARRTEPTRSPTAGPRSGFVGARPAEPGGPPTERADDRSVRRRVGRAGTRRGGLPATSSSRHARPLPSARPARHRRLGRDGLRLPRREGLLGNEHYALRLWPAGRGGYQSLLAAWSAKWSGTLTWAREAARRGRHRPLLPLGAPLTARAARPPPGGPSSVSSPPSSMGRGLARRAPGPLGGVMALYASGVRQGHKWNHV